MLKLKGNTDYVKLIHGIKSRRASFTLQKGIFYYAKEPLLFSEQEFILQSSHIFPAFIGYPSALDTSFSALPKNHFATPLYYIIRCKHERISPSYSMIFKFNSYLCAFFREYN